MKMPNFPSVNQVGVWYFALIESQVGSADPVVLAAAAGEGIALSGGWDSGLARPAECSVEFEPVISSAFLERKIDPVTFCAGASVLGRLFP